MERCWIDMSITENIRRVRRELGDAPVLLVAATKMNGPEAIREAIAAGVDACGENRVQEMLEKNAQGAYAGAPLHFIGHLQKNKAKQVVGLCDLIESVDSLALLRLIDRLAGERGIVQDCLLEINIGGEAAKSGLRPEELPEILDEMGNIAHVRVRGLMAIPPISVKPGSNRPYFDEMRQLFVDIGGKKYNNVTMDFLSMGMSGDYLDAVQAGANMIRLGTVIFGARTYTEKP